MELVEKDSKRLHEPLVKGGVYTDYGPADLLECVACGPEAPCRQEGHVFGAQSEWTAEPDGDNSPGVVVPQDTESGESGCMYRRRGSSYGVGGGR